MSTRWFFVLFIQGFTVVCLFLMSLAWANGHPADYYIPHPIEEEKEDDDAETQQGREGLD